MTKAPSMAAIAVYKVGVSKPSLMSVAGRVVVFDHASQAADYLPLLGRGRVTLWEGREKAYWLPIDPNGVNRACIVTEYDPYTLPPGLPVASETHFVPWRWHVHAAYVFEDCGQLEARGDGTFRNLALGEE